MEDLVIGVILELVAVTVVFCALFWQLKRNAIQQVKVVSFMILFFVNIKNSNIPYKTIMVKDYVNQDIQPENELCDDYDLIILKHNPEKNNAIFWPFCYDTNSGAKSTPRRS